MTVVVFGCGPMNCEPEFSVLAPGARTWQIVQTVVNGLVLAEVKAPRVIVCALDSQPRPHSSRPLRFSIPSEFPTGEGPAPSVSIDYVPLPIENFKMAGTGAFEGGPAPDEPIHAVVATGSVQPWATAAEFAAVRQAPLWVDVFGDPLAEIQSRAELYPDQKAENDSLYWHSVKLMLHALLGGDRFSSLSSRQRFSVIGQLGVAGRLNRLTKGYEFVYSIPYGVFESTAPLLPAPVEHPYFTVMWCGSFNTWMDVETLAYGLVRAWREYRRLRVRIVGGRCANYNDRSFDQFIELVRKEGAIQMIEVLDWQPLGALQKLYAECDVGLSIDRPTYEALLGSRTRFIHFLLAGKPVISTAITELAEDLAKAGALLPFRAGDADDLARAVLEAVHSRTQLAERAEALRKYIFEWFNGRVIGAPLMEWLAAPTWAPDKTTANHSLDAANPLTSYWSRVLAQAP